MRPRSLIAAGLALLAPLSLLARPSAARSVRTLTLNTLFWTPALLMLLVGVSLAVKELYTRPASRTRANIILVAAGAVTLLFCHYLLLECYSSADIYP